MKKLFSALILIVPLLFVTACEDTLDEFLDDYKTRVYFRNSGEQAVQLYSVNDSYTYELVVVKAGSDTKTTPSVTISVMNEAELAIYNSENFTSFVTLPADSYSLSATRIDFTSKELSKVVPVTLDISKIKVLPVADYVLPLTLSGDEDIVNAGKSFIIIKAETLIPKLSLERTTDSAALNEESPASVTVELPVSLEIDNEWTFTCSATVVDQLVTDFNNNNQTAFKVLPAAAYTLGAASFTPDNSEANISINVSKGALTMGERYALGLKLTDVSNTSFGINTAADEYILFITYTSSVVDVYTEIPLDETMWSSNTQAGNDIGQFEWMFDKDKSTYYQTSWAGTTDGERVWVQWELPQVVNKAYFFFTAVFGTTDNVPWEGYPSEMKVEVSIDGNTWRKPYENQKPDMPIGGSRGSTEDYTSPVIDDIIGFKYLRVTAERTFKTESPNSNGYDNFVAFAEFEVHAVL